jgi:hypothetical protein
VCGARKYLAAEEEVLIRAGNFRHCEAKPKEFTRRLDCHGANNYLAPLAMMTKIGVFRKFLSIKFLKEEKYEHQSQTSL